MKKINLNKEWKFIQSEIHKERPLNENLLRRELLFFLQIILSNLRNNEQIEIYQKVKKQYLIFG